MVELHLVAVCINPINKQIFIAKRQGGKLLHGGKWEFGCAKDIKSNNVNEILKSQYKIDFNMDIKLIEDYERKDAQPIPIAIYDIKKDKNEYTGIIFVAEITSKIDDIKLKTNEHSEHILLDLNKLEDFDCNDCVPDFKDSINKALRLYEDIKSV